MTCSTPRVYRVYKNACQPRQPVMISFPELPENALAFEVKRTCVLSQMHLRFR